MEHEIRFYLKQTKKMMHDEQAPFIPTYLICAIRMPSGAIQLDVNCSSIEDKIDYILEAYDNDMVNKSNRDIVLQNIMVV